MVKRSNSDGADGSTQSEQQAQARGPDGAASDGSNASPVLLEFGAVAPQYASRQQPEKKQKHDRDQQQLPQQMQPEQQQLHQQQQPQSHSQTEQRPQTPDTDSERQRQQQRVQQEYTQQQRFQQLLAQQQQNFWIQQQLLQLQQQEQQEQQRQLLRQQQLQPQQVREQLLAAQRRQLQQQSFLTREPMEPGVTSSSPTYSSPPSFDDATSPVQAKAEDRDLLKGELREKEQLPTDRQPVARTASAQPSMPVGTDFASLVAASSRTTNPMTQPFLGPMLTQLQLGQLDQQHQLQLQQQLLEGQAQRSSFDAYDTAHRQLGQTPSDSFLTRRRASEEEKRQEIQQRHRQQQAENQRKQFAERYEEQERKQAEAAKIQRALESQIKTPELQEPADTPSSPVPARKKVKTEGKKGKADRVHSCTFPGCDKVFQRPAHLAIHKRIHTGEKPYVCPVEGCGKRCNQRSALKQHVRAHTGEKPFTCTQPGCMKRFSTSSSRNRHLLTHSRKERHQKASAPTVSSSFAATASSSFAGSSPPEISSDAPSGSNAPGAVASGAPAGSGSPVAPSSMSSSSASGPSNMPAVVPPVAAAGLPSASASAHPLFSGGSLMMPPAQIQLLAQAAQAQQAQLGRIASAQGATPWSTAPVGSEAVSGGSFDVTPSPSWPNLWSQIGFGPGDEALQLPPAQRAGNSDVMPPSRAASMGVRPRSPERLPSGLDLLRQISASDMARQFSGHDILRQLSADLRGQFDMAEMFSRETPEPMRAPSSLGLAAFGRENSEHPMRAPSALGRTADQSSSV